jgi:hypothetical protein
MIKINWYCACKGEWGTVVSIGVSYGLDDKGFEFCMGHDIFYPKRSYRVWAQRSLPSCGFAPLCLRLTTRLYLVPRLRMSGVIRTFHEYAFMMVCSFTFTDLIEISISLILDTEEQFPNLNCDTCNADRVAKLHCT